MILTKIENRVATLTFHRPEKLNALSTELLFGSIEALRSWSTDPNVGAIVVTGTGRAFCAGGDLNWITSFLDDPVARDESIREGSQIIEEIFAAPFHWPFVFYGWLSAGIFALWAETIIRLLAIEKEKDAEEAAAATVAH